MSDFINHRLSKMAHCSGDQSGSSDVHCYLESNCESAMKSSVIESVVFTTVYDEEDIHLEPRISEDTPRQFKPQMAHQIFGESEKIFGYRDLQIDLKYLHNSCRCHANFKYGAKSKDETAPADDVMEKLNPWLPTNYVKDLDTLSQMLKEENHKIMHGEVIAEFRDKKEMSRFPCKKMYADYKVTRCSLTEEFKDFHQRFETYIIWFIDAANFIDLDDDRWLMFYIYEEFFHPEKKTVYRSPIGYCSVYKFYNYPNRIRARISQFFILPTHHRRGIGTKFYESIMKNLVKMEDIIDVTVEEPTPVFQNLRTISDTINMYNVLKEEGISISDRTQRRVRLYLRQSKLCKRQCRRLIDILNCIDEYRRAKNNYDRVLKAIQARFVKDAEAPLRKIITRSHSKRMLMNSNSENIVEQNERTDKASSAKKNTRSSGQSILVNSNIQNIESKRIETQTDVKGSAPQSNIMTRSRKSLLADNNLESIDNLKVSKVQTEVGNTALISKVISRSRRKGIPVKNKMKKNTKFKPQGYKRMGGVDMSLVDQEFLRNKKALAEEECRQYLSELEYVISHVTGHLFKS